ncbi:MAG: glycosyltransferase family 2 protein [Actinomycetota bacterium]
MENVKPIDIFITCFLRQAYTEQTLKYLEERTKYPYRLFIINQGGNDEVVEEGLKQNKIFLAIKPSSNTGIHNAWNLALAMAESDYFITSDNDILVPNLEPDWLTQMVAIMDKRPDLGALALQPHKFIGLEPSKHPNDGEILYTPMTGAVMRLMRRDAVWKAGGWEKVIRTGRNHEESTLCSRLSAVGYKYGYTNNMYAFHAFGIKDETDYWGYPKEMKPEDHGHRDLWPPLWVYGNIEDYDQKTWIHK